MVKQRPVGLDHTRREFGYRFRWLGVVGLGRIEFIGRIELDRRLWPQ
jgi:hypothetical protein